jgi:hypothetical protein
MNITLRHNDLLHIVLLLSALAVAYLLPFELLVLSYVILGPAHYFTEISWLHDRGYFLPRRAFALALAAASLGGMFIAEPYWSGVLLWSCLLACAILAAGLPARRTIALGAGAAALTMLMGLGGVPFAFAGILLPTFIHVSVFTLVFMTLGAIRARSGAQFLIVGAYLLAVAAILVVPPSTRTVVPELARLGRYYFGGVASSLGALFGVPDLQFAGRITGLLSFVYTYHYLNWFIKTKVIRWAEVPRARLFAVGLLSAASTGLCFYNFTIGITALLLVSLLHVLLEFPLDTIALRQLGSAIAGLRAVRSVA